MAPLAVDPVALDAAGAKVISAGEALDSVLSTLTNALAGCGGMAGDDPAGAAFGGTYNSSASKLFQAMAATRNGMCRLGDGVRMSAHNYSVADGMSDVAGQSHSLPAPHPSGSVSAQSAPSAVGGSVGAPAGWGWVAKYIGMIWPNGDSAKLRAAAAAWISAGTNFEVSEVVSTTGVLPSISAQQIPESASISAAFADATRSASGILQQCSIIDGQLTAMAANIDKVHAAILDLLSRICDPVTGIKEVWEFLTDQDEDEIKKIANDIRIVVHQFTSEVDALRQQIATTLNEATTILTTMGRYAEREWDQFLHHTDVGRVLNQVGQYGKGLAESAGGLIKDGWTYGPVRAQFDPQGSYQSWKELVHGMAPLVGLGGDHAPSVAQAWEDVGKNAVHWDEWKTNPAEAAGKSTFDIATLLIPGGGEAAAAAKGGRAAADAAEATSAASRAEAAATRGLENAPKPHPESPAGARPPSSPAPAPKDVPSHHGPTESKPQATNAEPKSSTHPTAPTEEHPTAPGGGDRHAGGSAHIGDSGAEHNPSGDGHGVGDGRGGVSDPTPNNPAHTGLHDPPTNQGVPGGSLPDLGAINNEYRLPNGEIDPDRLGEWAQRVSDEYSTITKEGVEGVYDYTTENYDGMNPYLRDIDPLSPQQQEILDSSSIDHMTESQRDAWEARITHTDEGLAALPPYRADPTDAFSTTWRGMRAPDSLLDQFAANELFSDPAYLSTSLDSDVAEEFARGAGTDQTPTLLQVHGLDGVDIKQLSRYMQESEILFPRATNFEVLSKVLGDDGVLRIIMKQMMR